MSCMDTQSAKHWTRVRTAVLTVVDTPAFEWFVLVLIFASSITLCFEDINLDKNKTLKRVLYWINFSFCLIFVVEMILKWLALGFSKYFTSFWTILDFIIVFVSARQMVCCETYPYNRRTWSTGLRVLAAHRGERKPEGTAIPTHPTSTASSESHISVSGPARHLHHNLLSDIFVHPAKPALCVGTLSTPRSLFYLH